MKILVPAIAGEFPETAVTAIPALPGAGFRRPCSNPMHSLICYCLRVDKQTVLAAIEAGCETVDALSAKLRVCTGCGGCRSDLEDLLAFNRSEAKSPKSPSAP